MAKKLIVAEKAKFAALMDKDKAIEFFFENPDFAIGDIYTVRVENILSGIDAIFVNMGHGDKMGFLHANDIEGSGPIQSRVFPKQKLLVQVVKEPTGNKGPRVTTKINLIGRYFVLTQEHENIVMSKKISKQDKKNELKALATLLRPPGFGLIIRTEALNATHAELEADFQELFLDKWCGILDQFEAQRKPKMILSDSKNLLYRVLRDIYHDGIDEILLDSAQAVDIAKKYLTRWNVLDKVKIEQANNYEDLLNRHNLGNELEKALNIRDDLPSGGYILINPTEALTVVDVNSGKFTSNKGQADTVLKTNIEAAIEIARQIRLRNIGGVIVVDFIDMQNRRDRIRVLEVLHKNFELDPMKPQIGRLSDLGLVEITRHRQERNLHEAVGHTCKSCDGQGIVFPFLEQLKQTSQIDDDIANNIQPDHHLSNNSNNSQRINQSDNSDNIVTQEQNNSRQPSNTNNINTSQVDTSTHTSNNHTQTRQHPQQRNTNNREYQHNHKASIEQQAKSLLKELLTDDDSPAENNSQNKNTVQQKQEEGIKQSPKLPSNPIETPAINSSKDNQENKKQQDQSQKPPVQDKLTKPNTKSPEEGTENNKDTKTPKTQGIDINSRKTKIKSLDLDDNSPGIFQI